MKFDPLNWSLLDEKTIAKIKGGRVWVRSPWKIALYVSSEGVEALAGVGHEIDVKIAEDAEFRVSALTPENSEIYIYAPGAISYKPTGEKFTNADRMPHESGNVAEVTRALRQFKLESHGIMRTIRAEKRALEKAKQKADAEPVIEKEPADRGDDTPPSGEDTVAAEE